MNKRTIFTYNIYFNERASIFNAIEDYLKDNCFKIINSNNEKVFISYPKERDYKIKGEFPQCIAFSLDDKKLYISAWLYIDMYSNVIAGLPDNSDFNLDSSKEVRLDGHMILVHKTNLKNRILELQKLLNL